MSGRLGRVRAACVSGRRAFLQQHDYRARVVARGSVFDGSGAIYDRPIVTFKVGAGEVVNTLPRAP